MSAFTGFSIAIGYTSPTTKALREHPATSQALPSLKTQYDVGDATHVVFEMAAYIFSRDHAYCTVAVLLAGRRGQWHDSGCPLSDDKTRLRTDARARGGFRLESASRHVKRDYPYSVSMIEP
jgi:hypothetical protein